VPLLVRPTPTTSCEICWKVERKEERRQRIMLFRIPQGLRPPWTNQQIKRDCWGRWLECRVSLALSQDLYYCNYSRTASSRLSTYCTVQIADGFAATEGKCLLNSDEGWPCGFGNYTVSARFAHTPTYKIR